jgi:hypothetical protein
LKARTLQVFGTNLQILRELGQYLAAGTARRDRLDGIRNHSDCVEFRIAGGDCGKDRCAFGANGQAERKVLDVTTAKNPSAARPNGGAHWKTGIWGVGLLTDFTGSGNERIYIHKSFMERYL